MENLLDNSSLVGTGVGKIDEVSVQLEQSPQPELTDAAGTGHTAVQVTVPSCCACTRAVVGPMSLHHKLTCA